jgi:hypothetical protein
MICPITFITKEGITFAIPTSGAGAASYAIPVSSKFRIKTNIQGSFFVASTGGARGNILLLRTSKSVARNILTVEVGFCALYLFWVESVSGMEGWRFQHYQRRLIGIVSAQGFSNPPSHFYT